MRPLENSDAVRHGKRFEYAAMDERTALVEAEQGAAAIGRAEANARELIRGRFLFHQQGYILQTPAKTGRDARIGIGYQAVEFVRGHVACYSTFLTEANQSTHPARRLVVAIDGPSGAGKSTVARRVAERLGVTYIDTGAMYRAVALWGQRQNVAMDDMHRLEQLALAAEIELAPGRIWLNGEEVTDAIRSAEVTSGASKVSAIPGVRRAMVAKQRALGERTSVVMEGRDIGTVVFPKADVKVFLDAQPDVRVRRRLAEVRAKGTAVSEQTLAAQMAERDQRDSTRAEAPLTQAPDAIYLDTTGLEIDQVVEAVLKIVRGRVSNGKDFN